MKNKLSPYQIASLIVCVAMLIVIAFVVYTNHFVQRLENEEKQRIEIWAEATRRLIQADDSEDLTFYLSIIEANTNIPVYIVDSEGNIINSRNVKKTVSDPRTLNGPIELRISDNIVQYIYYDESTILTQLKVVPYIEFGLILLFVCIAVVTLFTAQRSEQDRVWAGLSKETAHQLGTPISSLNAWQELLKNKYPADDLIPEMQRDLDRLQTIAERFSKVGSEPELQKAKLAEVVGKTIDYMRARVSNKVTILNEVSIDNGLMVMLNAPLFSWVLENLIKNALDAMGGKGTITIKVTKSGEAERQRGESVYLDITDTGHGIDRHLFHSIFQPGYTSKKRGWGLGLSLSKRIIEDYHRGKIFVLHSQPGVGTTFRIVLKESVNS
ncbi:MAG: HAMP domain-containing histidine kinase [Paludibacteraceae bacterium]|nr:HAMP domain-containing histidine kinase [Paludibacteraceae bacterium]